MANYILTNKAVQDLSSIWEYTVNTWSEIQADKYYFLLLEACQGLADGMISGRNYPEINTDIFGYRIGQHILFYRKLSADKIEIARIIHGKMDLKISILE